MIQYPTRSLTTPIQQQLPSPNGLASSLPNQIYQLCKGHTLQSSTQQRADNNQYNGSLMSLAQIQPNYIPLRGLVNPRNSFPQQYVHHTLPVTTKLAAAVVMMTQRAAWCPETSPARSMNSARGTTHESPAVLLGTNTYSIVARTEAVQMKDVCVWILPGSMRICTLLVVIIISAQLDARIHTMEQADELLLSLRTIVYSAPLNAHNCASSKTHALRTCAVIQPDIHKLN